MKYFRTSSFLLAVPVLVAAAFVYAKPVEDGDIWFHLAYARQMLQNHTLIIDHTAFSWTPSSGEEIYCVWVPELIFYGLYQALGVTSFFAMRYFCILFFLILAIIFAWKNGVLHNPLTWLLCLMGVLMSQSGLLIKPEMFSYLLMGVTVFLYFYLRHAEGNRWWLCYFFPAILLIWMNSHGGVIFGVTFLGILFAGEVLNGILPWGEPLRQPVRKHFLSALLLCAPVTLLTPYGWEYPYQLVLNFLLDNKEKVDDLMLQGPYQNIFHPMALWLHYIDYLIFSCIILGVLLWPKIREKRLDWAIVIANLVFGMLYARFIRCTYFWAVIFTFTAIHLMPGQPVLVRDAGGIFRKSFQAVIVSAIVFLSGRALYDSVNRPLFGFWINYVNPVEEAEVIRNNFSGWKLGNDYEMGSYLLWYLWPETKVFIDARYFPYKSWYREYMAFRSGKSVGAFLKKYPCDLWCRAYESPGLDYFVRSPEWKIVHYGPAACIFARKSLPVSGDLKKADVFKGRLTIYQAYRILNFCLEIDDIATAQKLIERIGQEYVLPQKKALSYQAHLEMGTVLVKHGMTKEAVDRFAVAMRIDPEKPEPYAGMGDAFRKMGEQDKAMKHYLKALSLKPDFPRALQNLAAVYSSKGRYEEALASMKRLVEIQPGNPEHYYNMACIYSLQNNVDESVKSLRTAVEKGFKDRALLENDPDLRNTRRSAFYRELMESGKIRSGEELSAPTEQVSGKPSPAEI